MTENCKSSNATKQEHASIIAEFKKGKIVFKQKPLAFESLSETMQEIVHFRNFVQSLDSPLSDVPQEYFPLIAKLVQESDKNITSLTKSLLSLLFPANSSSPALSDSSVFTQAVEEAIGNVAERVNYGINSDLGKVSPGCTVWRWEIKDFGWLPVSIRETALARLAERKQARKTFQLSFDHFTEEEKNAILGKKDVQETSTKMKEKPDKKFLRTIKEKRDTESTKKSAAAFANYFLKTKPTLQLRPNGTESTSSANDFESTFKPFSAKKGVFVSPINWFSFNQRSKSCDIDEVDGIWCLNELQCFKRINVMAISLSSYFPSDIPSLHPVGNTLSLTRRFRTQHLHSVRSIVDRLNEAELQGDQNSVKVLLATLRNRRLIPAKALFFSESNRPGYLGTWTKTSTKVGPRTPFALDLTIFDYDCDSDAEWEVDESGEDVDSEEDSIEDDASSTTSDLDHWLVDGEDITEELRNSPSFIHDKKRKVTDMDGDKSHNKKRKVVPLVPFTRGPIWEKYLGVCENDLFNQMRIQMFNDSLTPLNPFEFVSSATVGRVEASSYNLENQQSTNISQPRSNRQNTVIIPKTSFPDTHIEALLRKTTTINTGSFVVMVDMMYQDLKSLGIKKNALELKLREVLEKDKETRFWKVKESTRIQYGLQQP